MRHNKTMTHGLGLRNITPQIETLLATIGIGSREEFLRLGAKKTYLLILDGGHAADQEILYRLRGAEQDLDWHILAERDQRRAKSRFVDVDEP